MFVVRCIQRRTHDEEMSFLGDGQDLFRGKAHLKMSVNGRLLLLS